MGDELPSRVTFNSLSAKLVEEWIDGDRYRRKNGLPAKITTTKTKICKEWYYTESFKQIGLGRYNKLPARVTKTKFIVFKEWFIDGKFIRSETKKRCPCIHI